MENDVSLSLQVIGVVRSALTNKDQCPLQGNEGAPEATLSILQGFQPALDGLLPGDEILVITWLHHAVRDALTCYPRNDFDAPHQGVFSTRSPDRPNPIGLHRVTILSIKNGNILVFPMETLDGTPIVDIKPVISNHER